MGHRKPSNAEHIGVLGEVDWPLTTHYVPHLGAVVSADVPSASPVASATHSAASPAPTRIHGVQSAFTCCKATTESAGAGIGCCSTRHVVPVTGCSFGASSATGVAAGAMASFAAWSSSNRRSCLAFLAAAPARPAATFLGSFGLAVGEATTGAGVVTLSNPSVDSVWVFTQALCAGVGWISVSIATVYTVDIMLSKSAVPQRG